MLVVDRMVIGKRPPVIRLSGLGMASSLVSRCGTVSLLLWHGVPTVVARSPDRATPANHD